MVNKVKAIKNLQDQQDLNYDYLTRIHLLKKLRNNILKHEDDILNAFKLDLNKSDKEAYLTEINVVIWEIEHFLKHLKKWAKPQKVKSSVETFGMKSYLVNLPKGKVLIISPFNYPFNLTLMPLVGAIAAGNKVLVKMASSVKNIKNIVYQIINETFDKSLVSCIDSSDLETYNQIYDYEPNMVFFTGSSSVGKDIEVECVKRNIEYVTEMGGQCPCVVYDELSQVIYDRIIWAKFLNAGQTCVTINYILFNKNISDFINKLIISLKKQFNEVLKNKQIVRIINNKEFDRLVKIINEQKDNIIFGGNYSKQDLIIEPTIIKLKNINDLKKYGEIFGPILFVYELDNDLSEYINIINDIDSSPLAAYIYSTNLKIRQLFIKYVNAGGYCVNDSISHILNNNLPFGGVYSSGSGKYHGKHSFDAFSFIKPIVTNDHKKDIMIKYFNCNNLSYLQLKKKLFLVKKLLAK